MHKDKCAWSLGASLGIYCGVPGVEPGRVGKQSSRERLATVAMIFFAIELFGYRKTE
jgi:hypothetical protein